MATQSIPKWSVLAAGIVGAVAVLAQGAAPLVPPGPNKLVFPEGYDKGVLYATVDRPDNKQYREFYGPESAVKAARAGLPIPDGTVLTLAACSAKLDADGKPLKDANGRFIKDKLVVVTRCRRRPAGAPRFPKPCATATGSTSRSHPTARSTTRPT